MSLIKNSSIKTQIVILVLLINFLAVFTITVINTYSSVGVYKQNLIENSLVDARILSEYCVPALVFEDKVRGRELLSKAEKIPNVTDVIVFNNDSSIFVSFSASGEGTEVLKVVRTEGYHFGNDGYLYIYQPIIYNNQTPGSFFMRVSTVDMQRQIWSNIKVGIWLFFGTLSLSLLLAFSAQWIITRPILQLAEIAENISRTGNYNYPIDTQHTNEIGVLYRGFDNMLHQIAQRQTERDKANEQLRDSEDRFKTISATAHNGILVVNKNGQINYWNKAAARIFGYTESEEFISNFFSKILPSGTDDTKRAEIVAYIENAQVGMAGATFEANALRKNLSVTEIELSLSITKISEEVNIVAVVKDISERKLYEENLKHAKQQAEETARLKTLFLANVSHEIRTPMNAIVGFTDLLRTPGISDEQRSEFIDIVHRNSNFLIKLIDNILSISELQAGKLSISLKDMKPGRLMEQIFETFDKELTINGKHLVKLSLSLPVDRSSVLLYTDEFRLKQILTCLLENSVKFTEKGEISFGYYRDKNDENSLIFFVKDSGIGIRPEDKNLIFDNFQQIDNSMKRKYGGSGLGLTISRGIVEALGGTIWFDSQSGYGSSFYFALPIKKTTSIQMPAGEIPTTHEPKPLQQWPGKVMLIVEDEPSNVRFIKEALAKSQITIVEAANGQEAVNFVSENFKIDLILMDIQMPVMDGIEASSIIKKMYPHIPIVTLTAYATYNEEKRSKEVGCDSYFTKPLRVEALFDLLNKFMKP